MNGDTTLQWRDEPFQLYANGPLWKPPRNPSKKDGPAEAQQVRRRVAKDENEELNMILFGLDGTRGSIEEGMVFCLDRSRVARTLAHTLIQYYVKQVIRDDKWSPAHDL